MYQWKEPCNDEWNEQSSVCSMFAVHLKEICKPQNSTKPHWRLWEQVHSKFSCFFFFKTNLQAFGKKGMVAQPYVVNYISQYHWSVCWHSPASWGAVICSRSTAGQDHCKPTWQGSHHETILMGINATWPDPWPDRCGGLWGLIGIWKTSLE